MKSFVVMTYYQLMHSVAMALTLDEKPNLYFSMNYMNIKEELLERIRETGVFQNVVGITGRGELAAFLAELKKTADYDDEQVDEVGNSIFEEFLEPYYGELFKDADFDDTIYLYNDFQWQTYYIDKHFNDIVGVEDGYGSLLQQLKIHRSKGDHQLADKFRGKYFPAPLYQSPKIHTIISSRDFEELPDSYRKRLKIMDFNELVNNNLAPFKEAMLHIFEMADYQIEENSVLFLGQPLSRARYCNALEEYLFYKKAMQREVEEGHTVYFKGHPAETILSTLYETDKIHIMPKSFPVELLNYKDCRFEKVITFGSTGAKTLDCADAYIKIFPNEGAEAAEITQFIREYTEEERMTIDFYVIARELSVEAYINAYSCYVYGRHLNQRVHIVVPSEIREEAEDFFKKSNLEKNVELYKENYLINGVCIWQGALNKLLKQAHRFDPPDVLSCDCPDSDEEMLELIQSQPGDYDYLMVVEEKNMMFYPLNRLWKELKNGIRAGMFFQNVSEPKYSKKRFPWVPISAGYIGGCFSSNLANKVLHRAVIERFFTTPDHMRTEMMAENGFVFARKFSNDMYTPYSRIHFIERGQEFYSDRINRYLSETENEDPELVSSVVAVEINHYLDWRKVGDGRNNDGVILAFMENLELSEELKALVLAKMCSTLLYEKTVRFSLSYGPEYEYRRHLRWKVGTSKRILNGIDTANKYRNRLKKFRKKMKR